MAEPEQLPVAAARNGDAVVWDRLFQRYQWPCYCYVAELVNDRDAALDIVQETFINAARHIGSLRDDAKFGSWLFGIAHQKCVQHWRKRKPPLESVDHAADVAAADPGPDEWLIRREDEERFMAALDQLTPAHRAAILLRFIEDFSLDEIAAITETPLGTVKSRLHHATRALRKVLELNR